MDSKRSGNEQSDGEQSDELGGEQSSDGLDGEQSSDNEDNDNIVTALNSIKG